MSARQCGAADEKPTPNRPARLGSRLLGALAPLPRLVYGVLLLSAEVTLAVLAASVRLVVPPFKKSLLGETVLVTGAGHGIGRELAIQLAALGCIVVCWDTDVEANRATMSAICKEGGEVHGFAVDVSKEREVRQAARLMRAAGIPHVSVLINSTQVLEQRPFLDHSAEDIRRIFDVNVMSQFWTTQTFLPAMLQNKKGHVVCVCSMCGYYGVAHKVPYCSSKYALRGLMEGLLEESRLTAKQSKLVFTTIYPFHVDSDPPRDRTEHRLPYVLGGAVSPGYAASETIRAIQRNYEECTIPRCLLYLNAMNRVLPPRAMRLMIDFLAGTSRRPRRECAPSRVV